MTEDSKMMKFNVAPKVYIYFISSKLTSTNKSDNRCDFMISIFVITAI